MVYFEIHRQYRDGFSIRQISKKLAINRRTVSRYLSMSEQGFEQMMANQSDRNKVLARYEDFVKSCLEKFRDTPSAQMHDWLKENFADMPKVSPKTVFNFVSWVRDRRILAKRCTLVAIFGAFLITILVHIQLPTTHTLYHFFNRANYFMIKSDLTIFHHFN